MLHEDSQSVYFMCSYLRGALMLTVKRSPFELSKQLRYWWHSTVAGTEAVAVKQDFKGGKPGGLISEAIMTWQVMAADQGASWKPGWKWPLSTVKLLVARKHLDLLICFLEEGRIILALHSCFQTICTLSHPLPPERYQQLILPACFRSQLGICCLVILHSGPAVTYSLSPLFSSLPTSSYCCRCDLLGKVQRGCGCSQPGDGP